jgi:hypothetical protein
MRGLLRLGGAEMEFHLLNSSQVPWDELDRFEDRHVSQTREWMEFIAETQGGTPVIAALRDGCTTVGYFSGLVVRRMGIRILGSPFPGWTTPCMGFNLLPGVSRSAALQALETLAFHELRCFHVEVWDRHCSIEDGQRLGFSHTLCETLVTDLTQPKENIFKNMQPSRRWAVRRAEKNGVRVEEANDELFADQYYSHLKQVFGGQGLVPTYGIDRVRALIRHVLPTGHLLLLRARDPQGRCIGSHISAGMNQLAETWGSSSLRSCLKLRPNDLLYWAALCYWKRRGMQMFDWGGTGAHSRSFKLEFGGKPTSYPAFRRSRFALITTLRTEAQHLFTLKQRLLGRLYGGGHGWTGAEHPS